MYHLAAVHTRNSMVLFPISKRMGHLVPGKWEPITQNLWNDNSVYHKNMMTHYFPTEEESKFFLLCGFHWAYFWLQDQPRRLLSFLSPTDMSHFTQHAESEKLWLSYIAEYRGMFFLTEVQLIYNIVFAYCVSFRYTAKCSVIQI